jgi:DNA-binding CsgD family transcriptional regulator
MFAALIPRIRRTIEEAETPLPHRINYAHIMTPLKSMARARQIIFEQDASLAERRSAWGLYQHELTRTDPARLKPYTPRTALKNTLQWLADQRLRRTRKRLTPMQRQIVQLLSAEGLTQKQIAQRLGRKPETIKKRCSQIKQQLGLESLYQVVAVAIERGWVDPPTMKE